MTKVVPTLYIDEHVHPTVIATFDDLPWTYKIILIAKTHRYKGRNERDYAHELRAKNGILVTCDREYANEVYDQKLKSPCIVLLPGDDLEEASTQVLILFGKLQYYIREEGLRSLRDTIFYCAYDGVHYAKHGKDVLEASNESLNIAVEEYIRRNLDT